MASKILVLLVPLAAFVFQSLFQPRVRFGDHNHVYNHVPGTCRLVEGVVHGAEDIVRTRDGLAFISTGMKPPPAFNPDPWYLQAVGKILLFDLKKPEDGVRELKIEPEEILSEGLGPHGLGLYENYAGEIRLFVVNHHKEGDRVDIFRYVRPEAKLQHVRSVRDPLLHSVNDVLATGTDAFFATNDHYCHAPWAMKLERFLGLAWSNVVYFNGTTASVAADGFSIANSIATPPSGDLVYVSDTLQQHVRVFRRLPDHSLELQRVIPLFTGVDNLNICPETGDLWVGAHPSVSDTFSHIRDRRHLAPSQVLRIQNAAGEYPEVTELYANDGRQLSGSTAAVVYNRRLLIGTVVDTLLYCDIMVPM
ncbi:serum paraoxonase/arylesterase 2-like [Branchiostoma floridae]|uniref:Paraoxonase n=1 Tax=Branchiostoma floridae TaxID=7739 RepID=A0A9J7L9M5_BRAFL|nr:serum paraoxonase/arylesterase 2-like [Branchiostoma floridae]